MEDVTELGSPVLNEQKEVAIRVEDIVISKQQEGKESAKNKTYLTKLLGTPGKWISIDTPIYQAMDGFLSATFAHALALPKLAEVLVKTLHKDITYAQLRDGKSVFNDVDKFLNEQLSNYEPDFHIKSLKQIDRHKFVGLNFQMVSRCIRRKDFLGAYESVWGTWNPLFREPNKMLYKGLGGDEKPFFSTIATMGYNGLIHVVGPVGLPIYLGSSLATGANPADVLSYTAMASGAFMVLGIPVAIKKEMRNRSRMASRIPNSHSSKANPVEV